MCLPFKIDWKLHHTECHSSSPRENAHEFGKYKKKEEEEAVALFILENYGSVADTKTTVHVYRKHEGH